MSFILDALRKSDRRRRMNDAPDLSAATIEPAVSRSDRPGRLRRLLVVALLLVIVALLLGYSQRDRIQSQWTSWVGNGQVGDSAGASPEPVEAIVPTTDARDSLANDPAAEAYRERLETPRERLVSDPAEARQEIERLVAAQASERSTAAQEQETDGASSASDRTRQGQSVSRPAPQRNRPTQASAEQVAEIERRLAEAERRRQLAQAGGEEESDDNSEEAVEDRSDAYDSGAWSPEAAEYVRAWELPLSIRRSLPALTLNIHVFSEQLEERFVLINGERYISGDDLPEGARLVDIRREGAVVDYRDYRFLLEP